MILTKYKIVFLLILSLCFIVFYNYSLKPIYNRDTIEFKSTSEAFENLDTQLLVANNKIEVEFNKLPKYQVPTKDQPIKDALEFVKFGKATFIDTMDQNTDFISDLNSFEQKSQNILSETR